MQNIRIPLTYFSFHGFHFFCCFPSSSLPRAGRCGRAGRKGLVTSLVAKRDKVLSDAIQVIATKLYIIYCKYVIRSPLSCHVPISSIVDLHLIQNCTKKIHFLEFPNILSFSSLQIQLIICFPFVFNISSFRTSSLFLLFLYNVIVISTKIACILSFNILNRVSIGRCVQRPTN